VFGPAESLDPSSSAGQTEQKSNFSDTFSLLELEKLNREQLLDTLSLLQLDRLNGKKLFGHFLSSSAGQTEKQAIFQILYLFFSWTD